MRAGFRRIDAIVYRNRFFLCVLFFLAAYPITVCVQLIMSGNAAQTAAQPMTQSAMLFSRTCFLGLAVFLTAAYATCARIRQSHLEETLCAVPGAYRKTILRFVRLLIRAAFGYYLLAAVLSLLLIGSSYRLFPALVINTLCGACLYAFLPSLIGIMWGVALHRCLSVLSFGILALCASFLCSPLAFELYISLGDAGAVFGIPQLGVLLQKLLGFFQNLVPVSDAALNVVYGQSLELYRWGTALFWLVLGLFVLVVQYPGVAFHAGRNNIRRGKEKDGVVRRVISGVRNCPACCLRSLFCALCLLLCLVCGFLCVRQGSVGQTGLYTDVAYHMRWDFDDAKGTYKYDVTPQAADFSVEACDLRFYFADITYAFAKMKLSGENRENYRFTLYHGYTVTSVKNGAGRELPFTQDDDVLTINNPAGAALTTVQIAYHGWNVIYYANLQGAYLPGFSFFYPVEGIHAMYTEPALPDRSFTVRALGGGGLYSNLNKIKENEWRGTAPWLHLVGGMYREDCIESYGLLLPWDAAETSKDTAVIKEAARIVLELNKQWKTELDISQIRWIVFSPKSNLPLPLSPSDSVLCGDTLFYAYSPYKQADAKQLVKELIRAQLTGPEAERAFRYLQEL